MFNISFSDNGQDPEKNNDFQFSKSSIYDIENDFLNLSFIQQEQPSNKHCDLDSSFEKNIENIIKIPEENIIQKIHEHELKNIYKNLLVNKQSQIFVDHSVSVENFNEQKPFEYSQHSFDKGSYSPLGINDESEEDFLDISEDFFEEVNMPQDNNNIIKLIAKGIYCDQELPKEKAKEKNKGIFSLENDKIKNPIDIPRNTINSKSIYKNSYTHPILSDNEASKVIQKKSFNSIKINQNSNISRIHKKLEISPDMLQKSINSKETNKNSTSNGSTGDSTQKNNPNISIMNKYKYRFAIIHPQENLISSNMKLNMSSENLYINFKRKRKSVREEVKKHKFIKKAEDLEKPNLRKFKGYLRYKKKNKIKEFTEVFDKDRNFWDPFLKNSQPFKFTKNGKEFVFKSYSTALMNFIFSREDVNNLYEKFLSDKIYIEKILESLDDKSEGYKQAYLISLKNISKKYNKNYKEGDLELGLDEIS